MRTATSAQASGSIDAVRLQNYRSFLDRLGEALRQHLSKLEVAYVPVSASNRIPLLQNGTIDIECGSTTNTLDRQKQVAFSVAIFVSQPSWLTMASSGITDANGLRGKPVVFTEGSLNLALGKKINADDKLDLKILQAKDHGESLLMLRLGRASGFFEDNILLAGLVATAPDPQRPSLDLLAAASRGIGVAPHDGDDWEDLFFRLFLEHIEPHLGCPAPTILYDYPVSLAALSRAKPEDERLAERFELYVCGLELANAFGELTDAATQRARFAADRARKRALYGYDYPEDEDFLAALGHGMPESAGIALGVDRLVMLATGAASIDDVLWVPVA